jgi:hypothetical protein
MKTRQRKKLETNKKVWQSAPDPYTALTVHSEPLNAPLWGMIDNLPPSWG